MTFRALLLAAPLALAPAHAFAFTCTAVPSAEPALSQVWQQRCLPFWINPDSALMAAENIPQLVDQSFDQWSSNACTDLSFEYYGETDQLGQFDPSRCDNKNVIAAVDTQAELNEYFDSPDLLAVTLTSFSRATGEIFDADILFNTVNPDFVFQDVRAIAMCPAQTPRPYDFRNTLVHEIGHFIGFDHVFDDEATMFASASSCEVVKRNLAEDDIDAVCTTYPAGQPARTCAPADDYDVGGSPEIFRNQCANALEDMCDGSSTCSCRSTGAPRGAPWWSLGLLGLVFALRRQR